MDKTGANYLVDLGKSLARWGDPDFSNTLKQQLIALNGNTLPLQQGLSYSNYACDDVSDVVITHIEDDDRIIYAKASIFYSGMNSGSCCADDPTPVDRQTEVCVVQIEINRGTGQATISLLE